MPKIDRSRVRRNRRRRKASFLSKNARKQVTAIAKKVAMSLPEKKVFGFQEENLQLYHNKTQYLGKWLNCSQGTGDPNDLADRLVRIGDEFYLRNINIRLWLSNKLDRPNVMYKAYLFWYEAGTTLDDATCYFTNTNKMLDRPNNEKITVIDKKTIFSGPSYENGTEKHEHSYLCTLNANWKSHKITYDEGGSQPKKRDIGMMLVCYDAFGTLQTDNIASFAYNGTITIQDP